MKHAALRSARANEAASTNLGGAASIGLAA